LTNLLKLVLQWVAALMLLATVLIVLSNVFFAQETGETVMIIRLPGHYHCPV
jgi:hypothetical protein